MAEPKIKDGYTPIANELLEQVYKLKLNGTQFKIILAVWRYTYGFSRQQHELSESFISKATDTNKKQISRELTSLISSNIIHVVKEATFKNSRVIKFNKNFDTWLQNKGEGANQLPHSELEDGTGSGLVTSPGSELATQDKQYLKQNLKQYKEVKKTKKQETYSDNDELNKAINDFVDFRKQIKNPITDRGIKIMLNKLKNLEPTSIANQIAILEQSIMNGWKGIFPLKGDYGGKENKDAGTHFSNGHGKVLTGSEIIEQLKSEAEERGETWEMSHIDGPFK